MSTRKKSQPTTPSQPFKFADPDLLMAAAVDLVRRNGGQNASSLMKWKLRSHLPAYSIGDLISRRLNEFAVTATPNSALGIGSTPLPHYIAMARTPEVAKVYKDLWENGHKFHVMWAMQCGISNGYVTQKEWGDQFAHVFDYFTTAGTNMNAPLPSSVSSHNGAAGLVQRFFCGEGAESATIESKITKTGEFANPMYIATRYCLVYAPKHNPNQALRDFAAQWFQTHLEREHSLIPLATLVFKREHVALIRAHWINNLPLEASMFELWVDKSLDSEDSPHPLRTQYVRSIRNPLRKLGIEVVVKDSLREECFNTMDVPKFKTMKDEKLFVDTKVEQILNEERRRLGVIRRTPAVEPAMQAAAEFPF